MTKAIRLTILALPLLALGLLSSPGRSGPANRAPARADDGGHEVGFAERFALAEDRATALAELIPGTPEFYYYSCLHLQSQGKLDEVWEVMKSWKSRHGHRSPEYKQIEVRQRLLGFASDPADTYKSLARELSLHFQHERQVAGKVSPLPSKLDPNALTLAAWFERAKKSHGDFLDGIDGSQWKALAGMELNSRQLRNFLQKLDRPDVPNLPALVVRDLQHKSSRGFGSVPVHKLLLQSQLEHCLSMRPELLNEPEFIRVYLTRLLPNADTSWIDDVQERVQYLERLEQFTDRLAPAHNSLKSHVLQHRLAHDLTQGDWDRERFLKFIRIPRRASYANSEYLRSHPATQIAEIGDLLPLGNTEDPGQLVKAYLEHFFLGEANWEGFSEFLSPDYLRRVFVETKILAGVGDLERWYSLLDNSAYYEELEARVEIQFPPNAQTHYAEGQEVRLDVDVKNVDTLLVKVFEIDAASFARAMGREVDASIDLDGLVAGSETNYSYDEPALRRVRRPFAFPGLNRPGVYVIDFIGGGLSSRAVIQIGALRMRQRAGSAGQVIQVLDESGKLCLDASLRLGTQRFEADEDGEIHLPYSNESSLETILLESGPRVAVQKLWHMQERYTLALGVHVENEAMVAGALAPLLLRTELSVNGFPAHLSLLEEPVLTLRATDVHGIESTSDIHDLELSSDAEFLHEFRVPEDLASLQVSLRGTVKNLSKGEDVQLRAGASAFQVNAIDRTRGTDCPILGRDQHGYFVDVLGKNGEPLSNRVLAVDLRRNGFRDSYRVNLKTDAAGRIRLGELPAIEQLVVSGFPLAVGPWYLADGRRTLPTELHGLEGQSLRLPYLPQMGEVSQGEVSLLELRGGEFQKDRSSHVVLTPGSIELRGLPRGDYDLRIQGIIGSLPVRVTAGEQRAGWFLGQYRELEATRRPLHLLNSELSGVGLSLELANWSPETRVHVFASRFTPANDAYEDLLPRDGAALRVGSVQRARSTHDSGRQIGEEYRYILERRFAQKYPGNMLSQPGLLLNPWATRDSVNSLGLGGGFGGRFGGRRSGGAGGGAPASPRRSGRDGLSPGAVPNLGFLANAAIVLSNLRPDAQGKLVIPAAQLGTGQHLRVIVTDSEEQIEVQLAAQEQPIKLRDRRLRGALASDGHFSEQRRISALTSGESVSMRGSASARAATFDSLQDVFQLFRTLNPSSELEDFAPLMGWDKLEATEKQAYYSKHACHELHMFLFHKDPEFFERVLRPYLANKAEKTFIDQWLLQEDLLPYLEPWTFARLNSFEQALLARRLTQASSSVPRLLQDRVDLNPLDPQAFEALYFAALSAGSMDPDQAGAQLLKKLGYADREEVEAEPVLMDRRKSNRGPGSPGPAGPGAPGLSSATDAPSEMTETGSDDFFLGRGTKSEEKDADERVRQQLLFKSLAQTRQYAEHNYYHQPIHAQLASLIEANQFWVDYSLAGSSKQPFLSPNFVEAAGNVAEMLMALAVLDLPFEAKEHGTEREDGIVQLTAASPMILVRKEISQAQEADGASRLLVGQQYFPMSERYMQVNGREKERSVGDEFLRGAAYGCRVVVTNPTAEAVQFELLLQLPAGSIPLDGSYRTKGSPLQLAPYSTHTEEYAFYFPQSGSWGHFPAHATNEANWLAAAAGKELIVVDEPTTRDTSTWEYISQEADLPQVLQALQTRNLLRLDLSRLAWRMADPAVFRAITNLLDSKHAYDETLWSYGLKHQDLERAKEYLQAEGRIVSMAGPWLKSPLLSIDPIQRHQFERLEFRPLVRERAHLRGDVHKIYNDAHAQQYSSLMDILAHKDTLDSKDWMSATYHLLLQGRIAEALASFKRVDPSELNLKLQYDYMRAYMDFYSEEHELARSIAQAYVKHPVPYWQERFAEILRHLDEAEGRGDAAQGSDATTDRNDLLASSAPTLSIDAAKGSLTIQHERLDSLELRYYVMDVEFLFSTSPFVQENAGSFNFVLPNGIQKLSVPMDGRITEMALPAEFAHANVLIEARSGGLSARCTYYSNNMGVQWMENYGQLKVTGAEDGKPLSKVYVKVFRKTANGEVFHKDGYTDLRGRFDYVSVSGAQNEPIERFAVLVFDETRGAVIRELQPPPQ